MTVTETGIVQWALPAGDTVALQQFRDNLMVAAKGPTPHTTMYAVCTTMESIWDLRVLCPCRDKDPTLVCHGACMSPSVRCMGVSIYVSPGCCVTHAHPNALDSTWRLKHGAPLQGFWATSSRRTTNVFLCALSNTLPFLGSWGSFLLSVTAWMQLAMLCGYPRPGVRASATSTVHRVLAKIQWDVPLSTRWVAFISSHLPQSLQDTVSDTCTTGAQHRTLEERPILSGYRWQF